RRHRLRQSRDAAEIRDPAPVRPRLARRRRVPGAARVSPGPRRGATPPAATRSGHALLSTRGAARGVGPAGPLRGRCSQPQGRRHRAPGFPRVRQAAHGRRPASSPGPPGPRPLPPHEYGHRPDGSVVVSTGFQIRRLVSISPEGVATTIAWDLGDPNGLAIDAAGVIYVAETAHHRVLRLTPPSIRPLPPSPR